MVQEMIDRATAESNPQRRQRMAEHIITVMADLNPQLKYNAAKEDPYVLKRKSVRGGSWKDPLSMIRSAWRAWEYQNQPRSYIGFRCVRSKAVTTSSNSDTKRRR